ncbi:hypothetical protein [Noviherbaspirillum cavernae]|nr:hypothetical protein [Noviherbaspirillum cavernae]
MNAYLKECLSGSLNAAPRFAVITSGSGAKKFSLHAHSAKAVPA